MSFNEDFEELLAHIISQLITEHWKYYYYSHDRVAPELIEIEAEEFEMRAREMGVPQVRSFYYSKRFIATGCVYEEGRKMITKRLIAE